MNVAAHSYRQRAACCVGGTSTRQKDNRRTCAASTTGLTAVEFSKHAETGAHCGLVFFVWCKLWGARTCVSVLLHAPVAWALSYVATTNRHSSAGATVARSTAASPCCAIAERLSAAGREAGAGVEAVGVAAAVTAPRVRALLPGATPPQPGWCLRLDALMWVWPQALLLLLLMVLPPSLPFAALLPGLLLLLGVICRPALGRATCGC